MTPTPPCDPWVWQKARPDSDPSVRCGPRDDQVLLSEQFRAGHMMLVRRASHGCRPHTRFYRGSGVRLDNLANRRGTPQLVSRVGPLFRCPIGGYPALCFEEDPCPAAASSGSTSRRVTVTSSRTIPNRM